MILNFLCEEQAQVNNGASRWVLMGLLIVALVFMLVMPYLSQKKKSKEYETMINAMKVGDLVKTAGGIIGRIKKIIDKGEIKTVILETGADSNKSYMEFDMNMIYCILKTSKIDNPDEYEEDDEDEDEEDDEAEEKEEKIANETENQIEEKKQEENVNSIENENNEDLSQVEGQEKTKSITTKKPRISKNSTQKSNPKASSKKSSKK